MVSPPQRKKLKEYVNHFILLIIILTSVFLNGNPVEASSLENKNVLDNKIVSSTNVVTDTLSLLMQSEDFLSSDKDIVYAFANPVTLNTTIPIPAIIGTGQLSWPIIGRISQNFWIGHRAVDIAMDTGTEVHAADGGVVIYSGWKVGGYGYLIVIDHGNGFLTMYEHNSQLLVNVNDNVEKDQVISLSGSTGRSSGPHLHFEVRLNGIPVNPFLYLPVR